MDIPRKNEFVKSKTIVLKRAKIIEIMKDFFIDNIEEIVMLAKYINKKYIKSRMPAVSSDIFLIGPESPRIIKIILIIIATIKPGRIEYLNICFSILRPERESNPRVAVLQTAALPLRHLAIYSYFERKYDIKH